MVLNDLFVPINSSNSWLNQVTWYEGYAFMIAYVLIQFSFVISLIYNLAQMKSIIKQDKIKIFSFSFPKAIVYAILIILFLILFPILYLYNN